MNRNPLSVAVSANLPRDLSPGAEALEMMRAEIRRELQRLIGLVDTGCLSSIIVSERDHPGSSNITVKLHGDKSIGLQSAFRLISSETGMLDT